MKQGNCPPMQQKKRQRNGEATKQNGPTQQECSSPLMIPRRRSPKKKGRNLKKLQTDVQNPVSIDNLAEALFSQFRSLHSNPIKAFHPRL
jgi:hypothetical protein